MVLTCKRIETEDCSIFKSSKTGSQQSGNLKAAEALFRDMHVTYALAA